MRVRSDAIAQGNEQLVFELMDFLLRGQHLFFVSLEFRRDVALGVLERLLPLIILGNLLGVSVRDLDVVAEDFVEPHLEARDTGARNFVGLETGNPLLAAAGNGVQLVELGVVARTNHSALFRRQRWIVDERCVQSLQQTTPPSGQLCLQPRQ